MQTLALLVVALVTAAPLDVKFVQVAPADAGEAYHRSAACPRAVVLIHGLKIHPFSSQACNTASLHAWQQADSDLVHSLSSSADVYALAYSQNVAIDEIAAAQSVHKRLRTLKTLGYEEFVLVGNSAGGLVARQLAEDYPAIGITKVIQAGSPNTGSYWARGTIAVRAPQEVFLTSLTDAARETSLANRQTCRVPKQVEFVCLVGDLEPYRLAGSVTVCPWYNVEFCAQANPYGDGMVSAESQWPEDLRRQGVPMVTVDADHCEMMHSPAAIEQIVKLVQTKQPRWNVQQVKAAEEKLGTADRFCCGLTCVRRGGEAHSDE
jgi:pimeloyl-ACP methyl ester carboxylesterase